MQQITLSQVLPEVFRERTDLVSEVWRQELSLERGKHYLIEASSGAGKSSFCSFVYGWRGDYSGRITFDGQDIRALLSKGKPYKVAVTACMRKLLTILNARMRVRCPPK